MKWPRQSAFSTSITLCMLVRAMHVSVLHRGNSQRAAADLKPENIVKFSYENDALTMMKLIDFDAAVFTGMRGHLSHSNPLKRAPTGKLSDTPDHHGDRRLLCTLQYFSPELARHVTHRGGVAGTGHATLQLTAKHDVWQFGVILARMVGLEPMLSNDVAPDSREAAEVSGCADVWRHRGARLLGLSLSDAQFLDTLSDPAACKSAVTSMLSGCTDRATQRVLQYCLAWDPAKRRTMEALLASSFFTTDATNSTSVGQLARTMNKYVVSTMLLCRAAA